MVNIADEATAVLRGHLILEEVLNLWANKLTDVTDLYSGGFFAFKSKMIILKNLGMPNDIYDALKTVNDIRNRFSHRKGHQLETSALTSLASKVDAIDVPEKLELEDSKSFQITLGGTDQNGVRANRIHTWADGNSRMRFVIVFVILMLKLTHWIQGEFNRRGIPFTIVSTGNS